MALSLRNSLSLEHLEESLHCLSPVYRETLLVRERSLV